MGCSNGNLPGYPSARRAQHRSRTGFGVKCDQGRVTRHTPFSLDFPCEMANTTVRGALAIHGQNPQVCGGLILLKYIWFTLIM